MQQRIAIPETFQLLGHTYTVKLIPAADWPYDQDVYGWSDKEERWIHICDEPRARSTVEHTFFHELAHHMLWCLGRDSLSDDETFVDLLGGLLHQSFRSAQGDAWAQLDAVLLEREVRHLTAVSA